MTTQNINMDLIPGGGGTKQIRVSQYDHESRTYLITLTHNNKNDFTIPEGVTVEVRGTKPSGKSFVYPCEFNGNVVTLVIKDQMTAEYGTVKAEIVLVKGTTRLGAGNFEIIVEKASFTPDNVINSDTFDSLVEDAVVKCANENLIELYVDVELSEDSDNPIANKVVTGEFKNVRNTLASAIKGDMYGTLVQADDVSPVTHNPVVKVHGKNLCAMTAFNSMMSNGVANTYDASNHIITMGSDTAQSNFTGRYCRPLGYDFKVGVEYTISFEIRGTPGKKVACGWDTDRVEITLTDTYVRYGTTKRATRADEVVSFYSIATNKGGLANGEYMQFANVQIEIGNEITDYVDYIVPSNINVECCGKNLLKGRESNITVNGVTFTVNSNGTITANGTSTSLILLPVGTITLKKGKSYTLSGCPSGGSSDTYRLDIRKMDDEMYNSPNILDYGDGVSFTADEDIDVKCVLRVANGATVSRIFYPMIRLAETDNVYEPYTGTEHIPLSDGNIDDIVSFSPYMTILTDNKDAVIECEYIRDSTKVIEILTNAIIALGGSV